MSIARTYNPTTKMLQIHFLTEERQEREDLPWNLAKENVPVSTPTIVNAGPAQPDYFDHYKTLWESLQVIISLLVGVLAIIINR